MRCPIGGSISLNTSDPLGPPLFDPGYLTSQHDLLVLRQAFKTAIAFTSTPQWTSYLGTPINGLSEAIASLGTSNLTAVDDLIRNNIQNGAHVVGTSSMSAPDAAWGVVNPDLRVKGINGLRIVDASVYVSFLVLFFCWGCTYTECLAIYTWRRYSDSYLRSR